MPSNTAIFREAATQGQNSTRSITRTLAQRWGGRENTQAYVKEQSDNCYRPARRAWRRTPILAREFKAIHACRELGLAVPNILHFSQSGSDATLVLAEIPDARPLQEALQAHPAKRWKILRNVAICLQRLHKAGWYHGALSSAHILVTNSADHRVFLVDFEKARRSRHRRIEDLERFWRKNKYLPPEDRAIFMQIYGL